MLDSKREKLLDFLDEIQLKKDDKIKPTAKMEVEH